MPLDLSKSRYSAYRDVSLRIRQQLELQGLDYAAAAEKVGVSSEDIERFANGQFEDTDSVFYLEDLVTRLAPPPPEDIPEFQIAPSEDVETDVVTAPEEAPEFDIPPSSDPN